MALSPKASAKLISSLSKNVIIKKNCIQDLGNVLVEEIKSGRLSPNNFSQTDVHPKAEDSWALEWLFVVDTLNFCFWHHENDDGWKVESYTGYFALCAAINRAQREKPLKNLTVLVRGRDGYYYYLPWRPGRLKFILVTHLLYSPEKTQKTRDITNSRAGEVDILNPKFYSTINEEQLENILRSDTKIKCPLISERVKCLHEVGTVLLEKFDGTFKSVVEKAENSAVKLLKLIIDNFTCFKDEAMYKEHKVSFYKRAQILIGDIWACFQNRGVGYFDDISEITAFADYRIPQTLLWYGVFEYSEDLLKKLNAHEVLKNGDNEEIEIRGCSIHSVELLKEYATKKLDDGKINSILIDHFLWDFRRKHAKEILERGLPFHKTFSIYY
ncbi:hypothetical protein NQ317_002926 [Molorchus minor]|uniref:Queuosine 5'-phosphate N-glycosylase/hydrolase n=1 Tax=Molorchus minor TaxID=1323400 RepID=A0ABQ9J7F7_9CUCU|nr:hypothetical protein NQ317_002926 [Molorchus minor]